ncbi:unnamed protein product, partial [marine sediment metagenome]
FQMSSLASTNAAEVDPQNRLLHRYPARRLDAEAIRDSVLVASGRFDQTLFGLSIHPYRAHTNADRRLFLGPLDGQGRRSIYTKVNLMEEPPFLGAFNLAGGKVTQGRRDVTNVPTQALAMLNDPFVIQQADFWSERLTEHHGNDSVPARIRAMFQKAFGRRPSGAEERDFEQLVQELAKLHRVQPEDVLASRLIWKDISHVVFNLREFISIP